MRTTFRTLEIATQSVSLTFEGKTVCKIADAASYALAINIVT